MLARGIRSYHRPTRLEDALSLAAQGAVALAGGTRVLASPVEAPNVLDLAALDLTRVDSEDGDLVMGPTPKHRWAYACSKSSSPRAPTKARPACSRPRAACTPRPG